VNKKRKTGEYQTPRHEAIKRGALFVDIIFSLLGLWQPLALLVQL
jgi:hypothetical protein